MDESSELYETDFHSSTKSGRRDSCLKIQLLKVMQENGIINKLKSQVRQNLVNEVLKEAVNSSQSQCLMKIDNSDVIQSVCISLLALFLSEHELTYTLSVFLPEVGINKDKLYSREEILRMIGIDFDSDFYKQMLSHLNSHKKGFFWCFIRSVSNFLTIKKREIDIQTEKGEKYISLNEKMEKVDSEFQNRQNNSFLKSQHVYEQKMSSYQRELEQRLRSQMDNEIERFKNQEIALLKLKEEENYSKTLKEKCKKLEDDYQKRLNSLKDRERQNQENFLKLKESNERDNYLQRQQILRDINNLQQRELEIKKEMDNNQRELEFMKNQHHMKMEKLEAKEAKLKELEMGFEIKIQEEIHSNKLSEERRLVTKWKEVEILEVKLNEERKQILSEKEEIKRIKEELMLKQSQFSEMEIINYPMLKQKNESLEATIIDLKKEIQDQKNIIEFDRQKIDKLLQQSMAPNYEQTVMANELERTRETFKKEKSLLEDKYEALEKRLLNEIRQKKLLSEQYSEQQIIVENLTRSLGDRNECISKDHQYYTMGTMSGRSASNFNQSHTPRKKINSHRDIDMNHDDPVSPSGFYADLSDETRHRLLCLDEETAVVSKAYQEFKYRFENALFPVSNSNSQPLSDIESTKFQKGLEDGRKQNLDLYETKNVSIEEMKVAKDCLQTDYGRSETVNNVERDSFDINNMETINKTPTVYYQENIEAFSNDQINKSTEHEASPKQIISSANSLDESSLNKLDFKWNNKDDTNKSKNKSENDIPEVNSAPKEDDEIDPVIKQYMELVQKKKEGNVENETAKPETNPKEILHFDDEVVSESQISESIKKENSDDDNRSDSGSFW